MPAKFDLNAERGVCLKGERLEGATMKRKILEYLICPACLPEENPLRLGHAQSSGGEISEGVLRVRRLQAGIPDKKRGRRLGG